MSKKINKAVQAVKFTIHILPPSLNVVFRLHWTKRKRIQEEWDYWTYKQWITHSKFTFFKPVKILYTLSFNSRRSRDFDNYIGGTKFITDSLKKTFILGDDSGILKKIEVEFIEGEPSTSIAIEEAK